MRKYNGINRKKIMFIFGMVLIIATSFFYLNNARMDDFTSLMTDTTLQYQEEGSMKDYTTDVYLKDQTPLSITIKATLPKGTLARIEETDNTIVKNETLTYSLPEQLKVEDVQANKLYLEDDLVNSIGSYEIKNNVLTMSFDEEQINTNAEKELKIALVLDTDSSHITYDTNGSATLLFNNKKIVLNKYVEQSQETGIVQQIDKQIIEKVKKGIQTPSLAPRANTSVTVADDSSTPEPQPRDSVDFGQHIVSAKVSKIQNGQWIEAREFEDGDHVKVHIDYQLPAGVVDQTTRTITYKIPKAIKLSDEESGIVYASNGLAVGTYHITTNGEITIHFNEEFATGEPFTGYITFDGTLSAQDAGEGGRVIFGGDGGEITINPSPEQYDLNMSKQATLNSDGTVGYTIQASTNNGTEGTVKIEDTFSNWDSATAKYKENSFTVKKVDKNGNKTDVNVRPSINGNSFTIDNLPRLEAGESYEVTYKATATPDNVDGSGSLTNSVKGTSGETSRETSTTITISNSMIYKYGGYDYNTGKMNWTITINPDKKNIGGYTLTDKIQDGLTLPSSFTLKKSDGTTEKIQLPYTFPKGSQDTYTIEYQTDAPEENGNVNNTAYFSQGDKSYKSGTTVGVWHRDWNLSKSMISSTVDQDSQTMKNKWQAYITLPDRKITSVKYSDVIKNGTSSDDESFNGKHYAILSELKQDILNNIQLKNQDGNVVSNEELDIDIKFYSDEEKRNEVTNDNAHVKAFEVIVKRRDGSSFIGQSLNISSYSTIADLSHTQEGIDYYFSNKGVVNDKESEASVHYTKPKKLVKQGYGHVNGSQNEKYSSGRVNTNYLSRNGKLYYRIIFTPDSNNEISFTDTLPKGTKLVETALRSDYKTNTRKDNPAKRSSPEAVYYFNDNWEQYCDGDQNNTDISKYFRYSYDQSTNKVTFTFMPGYNKTDGDWQTNRNHPNGAIAVYYAVDITNDEFWNDLNNESKEYSNLLEYEGKEQKQETRVERNTPVVSKFGRQIDNTTKIEYTVNINPAGRDLDPNSDKIVLRDELELDSKYSAYIDASSLKLYEYDSKAEDHRGKLIDSSRYQVQMDTQKNILTITLPDELACVLVYQYDFDVGNAATPRIKNKIELQGEFSSIDERVINTTHSEAGVVRGKMSIFKVDSKDYSKTLPHAKFKLYVFNPDTNTWDIIRNGNSEEFETDKNGEISFAGSNVHKFLSAFNLYKVKETKAPDGYERNETPYYFSIYQADQQKTRQDAIAEMSNREIFKNSQINPNEVWFVPNNKEVSMYIPNDSNSIYVKKVWVDSENKEITNHPDSIDVRLIQNIKKPTGVNVNANIYTRNWDGSENIVENQTLIVKKGGTLKITLPVSCDPGKESGNVTVEGTDNYTLTTQLTWWRNVVLTVRNIDLDTNLKITLRFASGNAEYDYDKDYTTSTNVYKTVKLNDSNHWSYIWQDLPKQVEGNDCVYTLEEDVPSGYQVLYTNNDGVLAGNITVTNKELDSTELPDTGGFGTFGYYAIGALLVTATLFAIIAINKKKEAYGK